jgi:hypothetical protein
MSAILSAINHAVNRAIGDFAISQQKRRQQMLTPFSIVR